MANWAPLRELLASVDESVTLAWDDLDALVGGMPASALNHREFWSGNRSAWVGFTTRDVRVGSSVTFERREPSRRPVAAGSGASAGTAVLERASQLTGITDEDELIQKGLEALIRVEAGRRLAALGGSDQKAEAAPRRRSSRK